MTISIASHSTRVRGLKYQYETNKDVRVHVALYTSAWIEIISDSSIGGTDTVALYTSAWIEIA